MSAFTSSWLSTLAVLSIALCAFAAPNISARQQPGGSQYTGWLSLPAVSGATVHKDWPMKGATFPLYLSTATTQGDTSSVKRAVIVVPGKWRDCWTHFKQMDSALKSYSREVAYKDVSIMAPCYLAEMDLAGAATADNIIFGETTWVSGHKNVAPANVEVSAYEVMDELINYYLDTTKFPALEAVMFAGHSAGGQMTQRYAALKKTSAGEDRLHYWVANPGSFVWLTEDRPLPNAACEDVDSYKYGIKDNFPAYALGDANKLGRDGLIERYMARNVHYAFGLADNGAGDTRCQAFTQGKTHLARGKNFMAMIDGLGGLPANSTVDYIAGVSHSGDRMVNSAQGLEKLFKYV